MMGGQDTVRLSRINSFCLPSALDHVGNNSEYRRQISAFKHFKNLLSKCPNTSKLSWPYFGVIVHTIREGQAIPNWSYGSK